ncbi:MAG TPA: TIGR03643 family protein [Flavisolibacter sp.]|jgi:uncharacterized protein (TIGR03643 family)|nr:TIGR03643 family protein [Flavisolibacter sp.]
MGRTTNKKEVSGVFNHSFTLLFSLPMDSLSQTDIDRIIEMAWEDRTPFEAIHFQFQLTETDVITLMRQQLKPTSFKRWRRRVQGRITKHILKRSDDVTRFKSNRQRAITGNKISKKKY